MVLRELKALLKNKLLVVVLCAIMLIPAIYSGFFLASMWDPYGDLNYLPVAVVNNDIPVEYNGETLSIGEKLADNLKNNDSMAFNVVDKDTAEAGLKNGTYYMEIVIPSNFSENAATVTDKEPEKMILTYKTNPGKNYVSMKLSESAMKEIKQNIENEISTTYVNEIFNSINDMGEGLDKAVAGTVDMIEGEEELVNGNAKITKSLGDLKDGSDSLEEGLAAFENGLIEYTKGAESINGGLKQVGQGVDSLDESAVSGAKDISDGTSDLSAGVQKYTAGIESLKTGVDKITKNNKTLNNAAKSAADGAGVLKEGCESLSSGLEEMENSLKEGMSDEQKENVDLLADVALVSISSGISDLNTALSGVDISGFGKLSDAVSGIGNANAYVGSSKTDIANALAAVEASSLTTEEKNSIRQLLGSANLKLSGVESGLNTVSSGLSSAIDPMFATKFEMLKAGVSSLNENTVYINTAATTLKGMSSSLVQIRDALSDSIVPGARSIEAGIGALTDGLSTTSGLGKGINDYTTAVSKVKKGISKLDSKSETLNNGASMLDEGTSSLYEGLKKGVTKLKNGVDTLTEGSDKLVGSNDTLVEGSEKLKSGTGELSEGALKLKEGSAKLGDGMDSLKSGTQELNSSLAEGSESIKEQSVSDSNVEMMVNPVYLKEDKITRVDNNGHGMAAYMMSVGLWVACLAFCLMYPLTKYHGKLTNGFSWWASKAVVLYPLGILMVFVLTGILHFALGFNPVSMKMTILVGIASTACFMSIMYFFNLLMGKVGSFIMLIFMVLQLAGSAGTYPLEISGKLAQGLHKWMPFTYSVDAFRSTISGGEPVGKQIGILTALALVFIVMSILLFCYRAYKVKKGKKLMYDWIESKGLA